MGWEGESKEWGRGQSQMKGFLTPPFFCSSSFLSANLRGFCCGGRGMGEFLSGTDFSVFFGG